jgi:hypothetical protein
MKIKILHTNQGGKCFEILCHYMIEQKFVVNVPNHGHPNKIRLQRE